MADERLKQDMEYMEMGQKWSKSLAAKSMLEPFDQTQGFDPAGSQPTEMQT
jgi:hypothetical protein